MNNQPPINKKEEISISQELKSINEQLTKLRAYIMDDPWTGEPGIVNRVRAHNDRLAKLELKEKIRDVRAGVIGGIVTAAIWLVRFLFDIFKH